MIKWILTQRKTNCHPSPFSWTLGQDLSSRCGKSMGGRSYGNMLCIWKDKIVFLYTNENEIKKVKEQVLKLIKTHPGHPEFVKNKFLKVSFEFISFSKSLQKKRLTRASNKELWQWYQKYIKLYHKSYIWGEPIAWIGKESLEQELISYFSNLLNKQKKIGLFDQYFNLLITPPEIPFIFKEERDLLKIALKIKENKEWCNLFSLSVSQILSKIQQFPKINQEIEKHYQKYTWVPYDYGALLWDKKHFIKELKRWIKKKDLSQRLKYLLKYSQVLKQKQTKIINECNIPEYYQQLFRALQTCSFLFDFKKEIYTKSHYFVKGLLEEIAQRLNLDLVGVQYLTPEEIKRILLLNKKVPYERIKERQKLWIIHWPGDGSVVLLENEKARNFLRKIESAEEAKEETCIIKGQIACPGKYKGRVRIILDARKIGEMKKGEILVTAMTSPDYILAIKKAGAIVTDEGGLTCHAAIVSRELGIPCVIGTKIGTKVLKTGDKVEVDAQKGVVKKTESR